MLDLNTIVEEQTTYDIRLLDGTELHLKRPTQGMIQSLINMKRLEDAEKEDEMIELFLGLFVRIINRNVEGKVYAAEDFSESYDIELIMYVMQDYLTSWNTEVEQKVDFQ